MLKVLIFQINLSRVFMSKVFATKVIDLDTDLGVFTIKTTANLVFKINGNVLSIMMTLIARYNYFILSYFDKI